MASQARTNKWFISGHNQGKRYYWTRAGVWSEFRAERAIYIAIEAQNIFHEIELRDRLADSEDKMCPVVEPLEEA